MTYLRSVTERLARGRSLTRRLPSRFGRHSLVVSPDAALRWLKPGSEAFEESLLTAADLLVKPGDVVWDLGANVGAFGVPAAIRSKAATLLVEADPFLAGLLRRTRAHASNAALDLRIICTAIGDRDGVFEFAVAGRGRASSGLAQGRLSGQHGTSRDLMLVPGLTADTLLDTQPHPAMVKADLEGAEDLFVRGADRLIDAVQPVLYLEVFDALRPSIYARLEQAGYAICEIAGRRLERVAGQQASDNIVAIPPRRKDEFAI